MENCKFGCRSKCSFYVFAYFVSLLAGTAIALLYGFGIIPFLTVGIAGVIAIATLVFLTAMGTKILTCGEVCTEPCILRNLTVTALLTIIFGLLSLVFGGILIVAAIFLGLAVAVFVATLISAAAVVFYADTENSYCR